MKEIISGLSIKGVSVCVPSQKVFSEDLFFDSDSEKNNFINKIGVQSKRVSGGKFTTCDLCYHAALKLIDELHWHAEEIDLIVSVTQSQDHIAPGNAYLLHGKLKLRHDCLLIDIAAGCTGWIQALIQTVSMAENLGLNKVLILSGDTNILADQQIQKSDRIMGDMGTATALEMDKFQRSYLWSISNFGEDYEVIYTPEIGASSYRNHKKPILNPSMKMDSEKLHQFISTAVVHEIKSFRSQLSFFPQKTFIHQPNKIHTNYLIKKLGLNSNEIPDILKNFGNVSSASIPYSLFTLSSTSNSFPISISCHAFGVGLSIANIAFEIDEIKRTELIELGE